MKNKKLQQGHPSSASIVSTSYYYCFFFLLKQFFIELVKVVNNLGTNIMLLMCEVTVKPAQIEHPYVDSK